VALARFVMKLAAHPRWTYIRLLAGMVCLATLSLPALASLGGNLDSVGTDGAHMNARITVSSNDGFNIHQIQAPEGTVVDEYVSSTGTVFAVAWHGEFVPDMQQIMGTYFAQYSAALQSQEKHYGHRPLNIKQSGLVLQTGGHMRDFFGRAYIPSLLPQGFDPGTIQ
jgi:Protein of unknown function (DUF2844)